MTAHTSELTWLSTRALARRIAAGEISAVEALEDHLARLADVDPMLTAVMTLDAERALDAARAADAVYASGDRLGPLHGVPMLHKDTHDTAGLRTTLGSPIFADRVPDADALIIARLRAAGVVTTGKTNVPEFAAGSHTFNPILGTTVNPYDRTKSAAGSSGGSAAVIAAGVQASGDGSDMGGSLRTPGSFNNIAGFRPSDGRIPHALPGDPYAWLSQSGFMARSVADIALLMSVASGPAAGSPTARPEPGSAFDLPQFAHADALGSPLQGMRIGFSTDLGGMLPVDAEVRTVVDRVAGVLAGLGARVDGQVPDLSDADEVFRVERAFDFAKNWGELVRTRRDEIKESVVANTEAGFALSSDDLISARAARGRLAGAVEAFFADHDLLVLTSSQVLPFDADLEYPMTVAGEPMEDYLGWMRAATLISATGCPAISVPAGFSASGLPVGVQLVAAPGKDVELLLAAYEYELVTGWAHRHPEP